MRQTTITTHTPAPWKIQGDCVAFDDLGQCAQVCGYNSESNARLIASAPDLLAALKDLLDGGIADPKSVLIAHAVIRKAEGGAK